MKSNIRSFFFAAVAASVLGFALRADAVSFYYYDENGRSNSLSSTDWYRIENSDDKDGFNLNENWGVNWYGVDSKDDNVTLNRRVPVNGNVNLVIADGCKLTVKGGFHVPEGSTLTIYGQKNGTGELVADASGAAQCAGIGGRYGETGGTLIICGARVTATGGANGAGIGGGAGAGGRIDIHGGTVTATGGDYGAGIGGGGSGAVGFITFHGGTVTATGGWGGSGIGGGSSGSAGGEITVYGGMVTAQGGNGGGTGIGGATGGRVQIVTGTVTATGGSNGAGIGGGADGSVAVNGGTVTATGGSNGAGIGGGTASAGGTIHIDGGAVTATGGSNGAGIGGGKDGAGGAVTIGGGTVTATAGKLGAGIGGGNGGAGGAITIGGGTVTATGNGGSSGIGCGNGGADGTVTVNGGEVHAAGGSGGAGIGGANCTVEVRDGEVTATGGFNCAGIGGGDGSAGGHITLHGGTVTATGGQYGAGIGGDKSSVEIHGGEVTANGGSNGAGIGGGKDGAGGTVTVNGGEVHAAGGSGGAGIGGGNGGAGGAITIGGGTVTASGGVDGAGIGGGLLGAGGTITIEGGTVTASGGEGGAGIGGGRNGAGGTIAIGGGTVTATGGYHGAAIGGGYHGDSGSLAISEGMRATAGPNGSEAIVAAVADRVAACRSRWARVEPCTAHGYRPDGTCPYCGAAYPLYAGGTTLAGGWHRVDASTQIDTRIEVVGEAGLLLDDGAEFVALQGFHVAGTNSLGIGARSDDRATAGKLTVSIPEGSCVAGIGGNDGEAGGTVTVHGGVLDIAGGHKSAAIGGGRCGAGGTTTINGGFVTATGGTWGTGLGGGMAVNADYTSGNAGSITINGGEVTAIGGAWGAGIGGAGGTSEGNGSRGGTVRINGGTVAATGGSWSAGIGGGRYAGGVAVEIRGGTVTAEAGGGAQAIGGGNGGDEGNLAIDGMKVFASGAATEPVASEDREGVCRSEWARLEVCTHEYDRQGVCPVCGSDAGPVPYLDPADADSPGKVGEGYAVFTGQTELSNGWYVARGAAQVTDRIEVSGDVNLLLCDGAELTADAGIRVTPDNSLTLWAQSDGDGMGALTAVGSTKFNAGIGGNENLSAGTITLNGGRVNASANQGAAIGGGGAHDLDATAGTGGTVTIRGGTVSASSTFGSAIGGGSASTVGTNGGAGGTVAILGGTVTVSVGSGYAQPIGHGYDTGSRDSGSLGIADGMKVVAGANEGAASAVPAAGRVDACRNHRWARLGACPHGDAGDSGVCPWCGMVAEWARAYVEWAAENGVAGAWNAKDADGIANVFRYLFDKPAGTDGLGILDLRRDEEGRAVVVTAPIANGEGFDCSVDSAATLDWTDPVRQPLSASGETTVPDEPPSDNRTRFFRLNATPGE